MVKLVNRSITASWRGTLTQFQCEKCKKIYPVEADAEKCEGSHRTLGDFVETPMVVLHG